MAQEQPVANMQVHSASRYPNGKSKSELYDYFLSHWDFNCSQDQYEENLEYVRREEDLGANNCRWFRDADGRLVVADLELRDTCSRVLVTHDGFALAVKEDSKKLVFISYAREDVVAAEAIADVLGRTGFRPWLDRRHLRGGCRWKSTIGEVIAKSDFFVALLSSRSVGKRGFVQRELRHALETASCLPDTRVFIIPVRLDECDPSHSALQDLNWVDLFPNWDTGVRRLVQSLHSAASDSA